MVTQILLIVRILCLLATSDFVLYHRFCFVDLPTNEVISRELEECVVIGKEQQGKRNHLVPLGDPHKNYYLESYQAQLKTHYHAQRHCWIVEECLKHKKQITKANFHLSTRETLFD